MKLFREYKDIFAWTYEDLKTYDTKIIQHVIPLKENAKAFEQKLRKMHPLLEPLVKKELNKLLVAKIIFLVPHTYLGGKPRTSKEEVGRYKDLYRFQKLESSKSKR